MSSGGMSGRFWNTPNMKVHCVQGSFWGAILRDSRIFFSKNALILLRCENSLNINIEASGIELDSFRVDFVLFQWNLCLNSVRVNDTLPVWFRSVNWQEIDFPFLWRPKKCKVSLRRGNQDWILPIKQPLLQFLGSMAKSMNISLSGYNTPFRISAISFFFNKKFDFLFEVKN